MALRAEHQGGVARPCHFKVTPYVQKGEEVLADLPDMDVMNEEIVSRYTVMLNQVLILGFYPWSTTTKAGW